MRKNAKYMIISLLMFCFISNVKAEECTYEKQVELNNIASTVKATYEEVEIDTGETYFDDMNFDENGNPVTLKYYVKGFNVKLLNLTEELYVEVTNSLGEEKIINFSDTDNGIISLGIKEADQIITYSIKVISAKGECAGTDLRTINLLVPKFNSYSETMFCKENPEFDYCQEYLSSDDQIDYITFDEEAKKYTVKKEQQQVETKKEQTIIDKIKEVLKDKGIIIISVIGIVGGGTIAIIVIKRRRRLI